MYMLSLLFLLKPFPRFTFLRNLFLICSLSFLIGRMPLVVLTSFIPSFSELFWLPWAGSYWIDRQRAIVSHSSFQFSFLLLFPPPALSICIHHSLLLLPNFRLWPVKEGASSSYRGHKNLCCSAKPGTVLSPRAFLCPGQQRCWMLA